MNTLVIIKMENSLVASNIELNDKDAKVLHTYLNKAKSTGKATEEFDLCAKEMVKDLIEYVKGDKPIEKEEVKESKEPELEAESKEPEKKSRLNILKGFK